MPQFTTIKIVRISNMKEKTNNIVMDKIIHILNNIHATDFQAFIHN